VQEPFIGFTASTGRCGTKYMSIMLSLANCKGTHEWLFKEFRDKTVEPWGDLKVSALINGEALWQRHSLARYEEVKDRNWLECDSRFLTLGYYWALRDFDWDRIKVIMLKRDSTKVTFANAKVGGYKKCITNTGVLKINHHTLTYPGSGNVTKLPKHIWDMTAMELSAWNTFETWERQKRFKEVFPTIPTFDWDMDKDPPSITRWYDLLEFLGLKMTTMLAKRIRENPIINSTVHKKNHLGYTMEDAEKAVFHHKIIYNEPRPKGFL